MSNKFGIIIQARMGSRRFYGKSIKKIGKLPILVRIIRSIKKNIFFKSARIIVATTRLRDDDKIEELAKNEKIEIFRGSEKNVLERYYKSAEANRFKNILRLTSDNPFVHINFLAKLIQLHLINRNDYTSSKLGLPIGLGAEVMTIDALKKSYRFAKRKDEKEHVCDYILNNHNKFKIQHLKFKYKLNKTKNLRLTVDTEQDLKFCRYFYKMKLKELNRRIYYDSSSN